MTANLQRELFGFFYKKKKKKGCSHNITDKECVVQQAQQTYQSRRCSLRFFVVFYNVGWKDDCKIVHLLR